MAQPADVPAAVGARTPDRSLLRARRLARRYGEVRALDGASLELDRGSVTALVGPNGSGKTTLLRVLATVEPPDEGVVFFDEMIAIRSVGPVRRRIGWVPDRGGAYENLTVEEYVRFFAMLYRLKDPERRAGSVLELAGLEAVRSRPLGSLSRGMLQRASIARALVHDPLLLLCDEPLSNVDPAGRSAVLDLFRALRAAGKTVLFSTHVLADVGAVCDRVAFLRAGRVVLTEDVGSIKHPDARVRRFRLVVEGEADPSDLILSWPEVPWASGERGGAEFLFLGDPAQIVPRLVRQGYGILSLEERASVLEARYIDVYRDGDGGRP